jgi:hypothetical protein
MTLQQLEQRLSDLEKKVAEIQHQVRPLGPLSNVRDTFGMFAHDPEFDEIVKLGREYRQQANSEG